MVCNFTLKCPGLPKSKSDPACYIPLDILFSTTRTMLMQALGFRVAIVEPGLVTCYEVTELSKIEPRYPSRSIRQVSCCPSSLSKILESDMALITSLSSSFSIVSQPSSSTVAFTATAFSSWVAVFGCPSRGSSVRLKRPSLNRRNHLLSAHTNIHTG